MFGRLRVLSPEPGPGLALRSGDRVRVGRLERDNELAVGDPFLAPTHFLVECGPAACTLRDVSAAVRRHAECAGSCFLSRLRRSPCPGTLCRVNDMSGGTGVWVNRKKVSETTLAHGDAIVAGTSCFVVDLSEQPLPEPAPASPGAAPALSPEAQEAVLAFLARQPAPPFALVDAARDPAALAALRTSGELYYSLYDGPEGDRLADVAPYLVKLSRESRLLERMVRRHWGKSWLCLLGSDADFTTVRRHLRRFLMVESPDGKPMYFRFYDPRVLVAFLPTCTPAECSEFFGPVAWFLVESEAKSGALVLARDQDGRLRRDAIRA